MVQYRELRVSYAKLQQYMLLLYVFVVLSLPDGIKNMTCLYKMTTKGLPIVYSYNYYFSFLEIPIILVGLNVYRSSPMIRFGKIFIIVALVNFSFCLTDQNFNVVSIRSYEMFLLLLTGFSTASIVLWVASSPQELENILDCFITFQFMLQILSMITGASGEDGRYAAIGMGSGATASLAATYLVWNFFSREGQTRWLVVGVAALSIVLTGSRTNMLAIAMIVVVFGGRLIHRQLNHSNSTIMKLILLFGVPSIVLAAYIGYQRGAFSALARVLDLFEGDMISNIGADSSYLGRLRSIEGSIRILEKNWFGIPFSIYAIESLSAATFSMEYPHSTLLSYILLWSPLVAGYCVFYLVRLMLRCTKRKLDDAIYIIYYLIMIVLYGSPVLYAKSYALTMIIVSYIVLKVRRIDNSLDLDRYEID